MLRIGLWTTGNIAHEAVPSMLERDDMEVVGVYAHSADKVGKDLADLVGLDAPTGVRATDDIEALIALELDCMVYVPLHLDIEQVELLLQAGINIATTAEFMTGTSLPEADRARIEAAAADGGATMFGTGMNPGFSALMAAVGAGISRSVRHVRISESVDVSLFAGDHNFDAFGWGRPADDPGHRADLEAATQVYVDGLEVVARLLGVTNYERRFIADFAHATVDLDLPGRPIAAGTVAGIELRLEAMVDGEPRIEMSQRYVMSSKIDPPWTVEHGYRVEVAGNPRVSLKLEIMPDLDDLSLLTVDEMYSLGMRLAAVPVVNAIPAVCAAPPGIRTYADLPLPSARLLSSDPATS